MERQGASDYPRDVPLERRLIGGRYRIEALLGRGSMGSVYRARHTLTDNRVALKCILPDGRHRELILARFRREVSVSAHVPHDGIVKVYDAGEEEDGTLYLAMELLEGETLQQRSRKPGFTTAYGINVVRAMLEPLSAVHGVGIVHRDIKPENVFLHRRADGREQVKLLDFGIARDPRHQATTRTDVGIGTPYYMSPEQATNAREVTATSDVWSVGVMLYWLLSGRLPFQADTPFNTLALVCGAPHPPLEIAGGEATERLVRLIDVALCKNPDGRPPDASSLLAALNLILGPLSSDESLSAITYGSNPNLTVPWSAPVPAARSAGGIVEPPTGTGTGTGTEAAPMHSAMLLPGGRPVSMTVGGVAVALVLILGIGVGVGVDAGRAPVATPLAAPVIEDRAGSDVPASPVSSGDGATASEDRSEPSRREGGASGSDDRAAPDRHEAPAVADRPDPAAPVGDGPGRTGRTPGAASRATAATAEPARRRSTIRRAVPRPGDAPERSAAATTPPAGSEPADREAFTRPGPAAGAEVEPASGASRVEPPPARAARSEPSAAAASAGSPESSESTTAETPPSDRAKPTDAATPSDPPPSATPSDPPSAEGQQPPERSAEPKAGDPDAGTQPDERAKKKEQRFLTF